MKKNVSRCLACALPLILTGCAARSDGRKTVWSVLLVILGLAVLSLAGLQTLSTLRYRRKMRRRRPNRPLPRGLDPVTWGLFALGGVLVLIGLIVSLSGSGSGGETTADTGDTTTTEATEPPGISPQKTTGSDPAKWGVTWQVLRGGTALTDYTRPEPISFGEPADYFALPGIGTFRGDNYRSGAAYGTAEITKQTITPLWDVDTGFLPNQSGAWTGSGWTGQALIARWDSRTRAVMNLYPEKQAKDGLVEVIYATLDGKVYFLDLEDGSYTRDPVSVGLCFKGSGSLDPRGYPLLYVGSGDASIDGQRPRMYIISLIDGSILYQYGNADAQAPRKDNDCWCGFDSSPLVHGPSDTLIWPAENGLLYTIKLNTVYDPAAKTISVSPDPPVAARYNTSRSGEEFYWYGFEDSACVVDHYLYAAENGGMFFCVDLNTMSLVWAQDTKDDNNSSPVFEKIGEDGGYLYTAPSLHWTADENAHGTISIYKLNAVTGEIVWEHPYEVNTVAGVSGGVQSTPVLGRAGTTLEGLVLYTISRTPDVSNGLLVALDTRTGDEVWRMDMDNYAWSSPVAVYTAEGRGYVIVCDSGGEIWLLEGATGRVLDTLSVGSLIEASPVVYGNTLVIGTRGQKILGLKLE